MKDGKIRKPVFALFLLEQMSDEAFSDAASGDLLELYNEIYRSNGPVRAKFWLWKHVIKSFPLFLIHAYKWSFIMFGSYLKTGIRNLVRNRSYAAINIAGLSVGIACSLLISFYVSYEMSADKHHEKAERVYRVNALFSPEKHISTYSAPPLAAALKEQFPEVESAVRISTWLNEKLIIYEDKQILEKQIYRADNSIFDVFTIPLVSGDPGSALVDPKSVVISETIAEKLFEGIDPTGKSIDIRNKGNTFTVTGVFSDMPATSHLEFEIIESLSTYESSRSTGWMGHTFNTYLLLREGANPDQLSAKFPEFIITHYGPQFYEETGQDLRIYTETEKDYYYNYQLQPLLDIYLDWDTYYYGRAGNSLFVKVFSIISVLIVLLACINFMNLSTAQFGKRAGEIGMRKTLGAARSQLVKQFLSEAVIISFISLFMALLLVLLSLPAFNQLTGKYFALSILMDVKLIIALIGLALVVGFISGGYPAMYMSSLKPVDSIRNRQIKSLGSRQTLRRILVILQFSVSFSIIVAALVIYSQVEYIQNADLGFNSDNIVVIERSYGLGENREAFIQELENNPAISTVSSTNSLPGKHFDTNGHRLEGWDSTESQMLHTMYSDYRYLDLLGLKLVDGRFFSRDIPTDLTHSVVINQNAVKALGLEEPVGKRLHKEFGGAEPGEFVTIIGVVEDIKFLSLHHTIEPMILRPQSHLEGTFTSVRFSGNVPETVEYIQDVWAEMTNGQPLSWTLFSDDLQMLYSSEIKTGKILLLFSVLAVFIACLGLFGLISYTTAQRTKEVGIRKVLGAGLHNILILLTRELIILICISTLISAPAAFYLSSKWLENFAFRIDLNVSVFLISGVLLLIIALLTSASRVIPAAMDNPVNAIRRD